MFWENYLNDSKMFSQEPRIVKIILKKESKVERLILSDIKCYKATLIKIEHLCFVLFCFVLSLQHTIFPGSLTSKQFKHRCVSVGWSSPSVNRKVADSIPGRGTCLGCGPGPQSLCLPEATDLCFSLTVMFHSLSVLSL